MNPNPVEILGTVLFAVAILHTFLAGRFKAWGNQFPEGSIAENLLHLLGETEVVFGFWAAALFFGMAVIGGWHSAVTYLEGLNYTEPMFVLVIMTMAATRPVLMASKKLIGLGAALLGRLKVPEHVGFYLSCLAIGPLLGSFITEPAAMTITALLLRDRYYRRGMSRLFMYSTLGVLFVNVSIGGTLTHFAAPPVLMVASKWGWGFGHMIGHFGWKAAIAVVVNAVGATMVNRGSFRAMIDGAIHKRSASEAPEMVAPPWLIAIHLGFMAFVVLTNHHWPVFMGAFVFFLGVVKVTHEYQTTPKVVEAMLVGFFLCGLVVLGGLQAWWLGPAIASLGDFPLYMGATGLTAVTDNAALTYLGSQVEGMSDAAKYALVAGAVTGGGLTLIANAPNPAGYSVLKAHFEDAKEGKGFSPMALIVAALPPTIIAIFCLWFLPH